MIRFNDVSKTYPGGFLALKKVSFIEAHEYDGKAQYWKH